MTADDEAATVCAAMYDAAGVIARELARAIDALVDLDTVPLANVPAVVDAAVARCRRAYDAAAWVREQFA